VTIGANSASRSGRTASSTSPANIATASAPTAPASTCGRTTTARPRPSTRASSPSTGCSSASATQDRGLQPSSSTRAAELGGGWELYAFGSYGNARRAQRGQLPPAERRRQPRLRRARAQPGAERRQFRPLTPDGFLPLIDTELEDYSGTVGVRGESPAGRPTFSVGRGHNSFDYDVRNSLNTSFGPQSQRTSTPAGCATARTSPTSISRASSSRASPSRCRSRSAPNIAREFQDPPGRLQSYATGPLFRASFTTTAANCAAQQGVFNAATGICSFPGRAAPAGAQGFPGIPAAARPTSAATATPPMSSSTPIRSRADHHAGRPLRAFLRLRRHLNGKFAARFEPVEGYAVRGSISNGFRAPSLHQQFFTTTSTNFIGGVPVDIATLAVNSPVARALGSRDLEPEKSVNMSLGATANPFRGLTLTADSTRSRSRTGSSSPRISARRQRHRRRATPRSRRCSTPTASSSVGAARFFINGLDTTTRGVDVVGTYRWRAGAIGNWTLTAAYNYNKTKIDERSTRSGRSPPFPGIVLFGRVEGIRFTDGQPRDKIVLSADGDIGNFGITARTTRYGKVVSPGARPDRRSDQPDRVRAGRHLPRRQVDHRPRASLQGGFGGLEFAIGANNLFDVYPDRSPFGRPASIGGVYPANQQYIPYSIFSPFGFNGRFLYDRARRIEPAQQGKSPRHLCLRRLRAAGLQLGSEVRERHRLAELHRADRQCRADQEDRGPVRHPHRSPLPPLRRPSRPRLRRRPAADRQALLHERRGDELRSSRRRPCSPAAASGAPNPISTRSRASSRPPPAIPAASCQPDLRAGFGRRHRPYRGGRSSTTPRRSATPLSARFFRTVDPLDAGGQFCDRGYHYRSAIFVADAAAASRRRRDQKAAAVLKKPVAILILPAAKFYPAEGYHQDYYKKNPIRCR
jgi:hypothetical protein